MSHTGRKPHRRKKQTHQFQMETLVLSINQHLMSRGISFRLDGIREMEREYRQVNVLFLEELVRVSTDLLLWCHYLSESIALLEWLHDTFQLEADWLIALEDPRYPDAQLEARIQEAKQVVRETHWLAELLRAKHAYFERAHLHSLREFHHQIHNWQNQAIY